MRIRKGWEYILSIFIAIVGLSFVIFTFYFQRGVEKQRVLQSDLLNIRTSILLYKMVNKQNPKSLEILAKATFKFPNSDLNQKYLNNVKLVDDKLLDPFGKLYDYDPKTGRIKSKIYTSW